MIVHNVQKILIMFAQASLTFFEFAVGLIGAINFCSCLFVCLFREERANLLNQLSIHKLFPQTIIVNLVTIKRF